MGVNYVGGYSPASHMYSGRSDYLGYEVHWICPSTYQSFEEKRMDLLNNQQGRQAGTVLDNYMFSCASACTRALNNGNLFGLDGKSINSAIGVEGYNGYK